MPRASHNGTMLLQHWGQVAGRRRWPRAYAATAQTHTHHTCHFPAQCRLIWVDTLFVVRRRVVHTTALCRTSLGLGCCLPSFVSNSITTEDVGAVLLPESSRQGPSITKKHCHHQQEQAGLHHQSHMRKPRTDTDACCCSSTSPLAVPPAAVSSSRVTGSLQQQQCHRQQCHQQPSASLSSDAVLPQ